ncbi:hypothetical protein OHA72_37730 [Dactylosporangium sp. NBC_01737]|uniref:hypothetical protein n=1 Tax=Dactylosporangium sp. NBC_01737 TaxID=2975959 RepID=UPI002E10A31A|nr:hypothetical protein OHA72_37730 [Dactylosporangium sp. NBC_01737]
MSAPDDLARRWGHSFEEDHDDVRVYRPADHPFPPARGRDGLDLRPDGTYVDIGVGRGDAGSARPGTWRADGGRLRLTPDAGGERSVQIVLVAPDRLELRPGGAS